MVNSENIGNIFALFS